MDGARFRSARETGEAIAVVRSRAAEDARALCNALENVTATANECKGRPTRI